MLVNVVLTLLDQYLQKLERRRSMLNVRRKVRFFRKICSVSSRCLMGGAFLIASQLHVGTALAETGVADLPISEIPVPNAVDNKIADSQDQMIIFFSGDGGWASFVDGIGQNLARAGLPVVGISSTSFFGTAQSPDSIAKAIETVFAHYSVLWGKSRFMLAGFSFGADVLPFAIESLDEKVLRSLRSVALISPGRDANFEFNVSQWLPGWMGVAQTRHLIGSAQIHNLKAMPTACLYGTEERSISLCTSGLLPNTDVHKFPGDHHLNEDITGATAVLLKLALQKGSEG